MLTKFTVYRPGEPPEEGAAELPAKPTTAELHAIVDPLLGTRNFERVNVFWDGQYTDMFVDELSAVMGLERNAAATVIYRNNVMTHQKPKPDPAHLPEIYGPAVLFARKVWF